MWSEVLFLEIIVGLSGPGTLALVKLWSSFAQRLTGTFGLEVLWLRTGEERSYKVLCHLAPASAPTDLAPLFLLAVL